MSSRAAIVIPTYKRNALLCTTLNSVFRQSYPHIEIIVVDDAADENTEELVQKIDRGRNRVRYLQRRKHSSVAGASSCRNIGYLSTHAEYIMFLDDDDFIAPRCITDRVAVLEANKGAGACVGQCAVFRDAPGDVDKLWCDWSENQDDLEMFLQARVPWQTSGPLWRKGTLERTGLWDTSLITGHDYEYHIRALARKVHFCRRSIVDYYWRLPRGDSFSNFERMKVHHRDGAHLAAFVRAMEGLTLSNAWSENYYRTAWSEAVRLGILCRLYGGAFTQSTSGIDYLFRQGVVRYSIYAEVKLAFVSWGSVAGRIPAMSYLRLRGYSAR